MNRVIGSCPVIDPPNPTRRGELFIRLIFFPRNYVKSRYRRELTGVFHKENGVLTLVESLSEDEAFKGASATWQTTEGER